MSSAPARLQVRIVGGGLAGLAAASFLREHHDVTVLERYKLEFTRNDYAISLAPNARRLLLKQGIQDENLDATILNYVWGVGPDGKIIREALAESLSKFGTTTVFTRRSRLHAELHRLATSPQLRGPPARIIDEVKIAAVDVDAGIIITESGETYTGDLIVGADGINSTVRSAVLSAAGCKSVAPVPSGLTAYLCTVPASFIRSEPALNFLVRGDEKGMGYGMAGLMGSGDPRKRVLVYPADSPSSSSGEFQIAAYHPEDAWVDTFTQTGSSIIKGVPTAGVVADFSPENGFHLSVGNMFAAVSKPPDVWRIRDVPRMSAWCAARAVIIGDAAHAVTPHFGQGCNIAIEDGEALAFFLRSLPSSSEEHIRQALHSFAELRIPRAHMVQFASRQRVGLLTEEEKKERPQFDSGGVMDKIYAYKSAKEEWDVLKSAQ
ncbi:hypothetical protein FB45DRAFT_898105 [Roridomyces roridus]|uniref:FAD-binding domain-containing protein n=1 Tax=Roridomyces roridus TaxID=1738132 RepID=A0AAD7CBY7_9AGAR|nr:hypothetical protein FB45DRAFT_898105 [Roridomyces roridus]